MNNDATETPRLNIKVERYKDDPEAQGVIKPADGSWQLVLDKDGYPHLYIRCKLEKTDTDPETGFLCIEDLLENDVTIPELMQSTFGGKLSPEEEEKAATEWNERRKDSGIPCPR